jgi:Cu-Zn family superoxide dismutase
MRSPIAAALTLVLAGCASTSPPATTGNTARAELRNASGQAVGMATVTEISGGVRVVVDARGLPAGAKAVHVHEVGACDPPAFTTAGGHFNPARKQHGMLNPQGPHAGDLPNITIAADGTGRLEAFSDRLTLAAGPSSVFDADGSAVVIHASPDDFRSDPAGNAGARIACGVLRK